MVVSQEQRSPAVLSGSGWRGGGSIPAARNAGSPRAAPGQFITKVLNRSCSLLAKVNIYWGVREFSLDLIIMAKILPCIYGLWQLPHTFPVMLFVRAVPWDANGMFSLRPWSFLSPKMWEELWGLFSAL